MSHSGQGSKRDSSSRRPHNKPQTAEPHHPSIQRRSKSDQEAHASHSADSSTVAPGAPRPPLQKVPSSPLVPRTHQRNDTAWQVLKPAAVRPDLETFTRDSITDDPFFSRYRNPKTERLARDFKAQLAGVRTRGEAPDDEIVRLTTDENHEGVQDEPHVDMNICVLGPRGVGKTTLIESTFDYSPSASDDPSSRTLFIDGVHYSLHFVERLSYDVCFQNERHTTRPPWKGDGPLARIDGAILLFDAMKPDSLTLVPQVLDALQKARIPNVLVSSKCDVHFSQPEIEPEVVEAKARLLANCQKTPQITREVPDTFRNIVYDLTKEIALGRLDNPPISTPIRRRSRSSVHAPSPPPSTKHSRAASDVSARSVRNSTSQGNISAQFNAHGQLLALPSEGPTKLRPNHSSVKANLERPKMNVDTHRANLLQLPAENSPQSFLDLRDSLDIDVRPPADGPASVPAKPEQSTELTPMTFEDLVARLLVPPTSQTDAKFSAMFLTFYRFFAAPSQLLDEIMKHFVSSTSPVLRERDLMVVDQWLTAFPGDFGHPIAKQKLSGFLSKVVGDDRIAAAAKQLLSAVELITEDDDTEWAESDSSLAPDVPPPPSIIPNDRVLNQDRDRPSTAKTFFSTSSLDSSTASNPSTPTTPISKSQHRFHRPAADLDSKMIFSSVSSLTLTAMGPSLYSPQSLSNSIATAPDSIASSSSNFNITETAQRHAAQLVPTNSQPLTKTSFRHFLSFPDELIARELTRIDWIMFSSIRPRDIIRHVTVPVSNRPAYRSLENVTRMIDHFNHIAYWTTNLVLFRDKPKHRAQTMEKLMRVARKLRELNNYNSLGALVAGLHGTSVHRLAATRALLPTDVQKDFMKLEILMGSEKGSFAYRLAWENSVGARVPFLPLHRRDLVVTEQGSRTFVDGPDAANPSKEGSPDLIGNAAAVSPSALGSPQADATAQERSDWYSASNGSTPTLRSGNPFTPSKSIASGLGGLQSDPEVSLSSSSPTRLTTHPESSKQYINTPKLALLSTALLSLTAAQARPYPSFHRNDDIRSFLLDTVCEKDEEKLYERSVALEPAGAGGSAGLSLGLGGHGSGALLAMGLGGGEGRRKIPIPAWLARHGLRVE